MRERARGGVRGVERERIYIPDEILRGARPVNNSTEVKLSSGCEEH